jgi:hypothetical protein
MKLRGKLKILRVSAQDLEDFKQILRIQPSSTREKRENADGGALLPPEIVKTMAAIATNTWRAKTKMTDALTGEIREEMKRVGRHVEAIYRNLADLGIVIRDHTGEAYDEGQPMKVVASKPTAGLDRKRISETLLPSIFWNDHLIQNGEIEIAVPITEGSSGETNSVSS